MGKRIVKYEEGASIIKTGDTEQRMYIIVKGEVEVSINDGRRKVVVATLKKKDFFGEISLFNKTPRSADAVAKTKTELTYIDTLKELDDFLGNNPKYSQKMVLALGQRLAKTDELLRLQLGGRGKSVVMGFEW